MLYLLIFILENMLSTKNHIKTKTLLFWFCVQVRIIYINIFKQCQSEHWNWLNNISAQADTNEPVSDLVWLMSTNVECHALVTMPIARCTKVRWDYIIAPHITGFVTSCVTRDEEAGVFHVRAAFLIADQQLVRESLYCSHAIPQSIGVSNLPIVLSNFNGLSGLSLEVGPVSGLVINEHNFFEL